jgi:penicillin-binding protein 1A
MLGHSRGSGGSGARGGGKRPPKPLRATGRAPLSEEPKQKKAKPQNRRKARKGKNQAKGNKPRRSVAGVLAKWVLVASIWAVAIGGGTMAFFALDLPDVDAALNATRQPNVTLLAADGSEIAVFGDVYGIPAGIGDIPPSLVHAVLATEDRRFYGHFGLDPIGLARAMVANIRAGRIVQGGSTITQQVAKNLFLTPDRTIRRKIQEALLALWLERHFTKDQILTIYLNRVYFGAGTYGVAAAADKFFGVEPKRLSVYQSAMLAGLVKAPTRLNPESDAKAADARARTVLANMVAAGYLDEDDLRAVRRPSARSATRGRPSGIGRYFADWVLDQVPDFIGPAAGDITVATTLDPAMQRFAERIVAGTLAESGGKLDVGQGALVAMRPDGAVVAMVGGRDYADSQFNRAVQARRQPGSAFKPVVYLAGLEAGLTPEAVLVDESIRIGNWEPQNYKREFRGPVSVKEALANSINTVAVKVAEHAGRDKVASVARRLGFTSKIKPTPSLALGTSEVSLVELTAAYGTFANGGYGVWAYAVTEIRDRAGRVLYRRAGDGPGRVAAPEHVAAMNDMLAEVIETGTGKAARLASRAAGKTGTSQDFRDAWFIGYTPGLVAGVWVGNDSGAPMKNVSGGGLPATLWRRFMAEAGGSVPLAAPTRPVETGPAPAREVTSDFWRRLVETLGGG